MTATNTPLDVEPQSARTGAPLLSVLAPIVIVAVFVVGYAATIGWPAWPVTDAPERIAYSAIAAAGLGCVAALTSRPGIRLAMHVLAALACIVATIWPNYANGTWGMGTFALWVVATVYIITRGARLLYGLSEDHGVLGWLIMLGMAASGGALLMATGSLKLGQAGFSLAAGIALALIIAAFVPAVRRSAGASLVVMSILGALLVSGQLWSALPQNAGLAVVVAPWLAQVVRLKSIAGRPLWQRVAIGLVVAAIPATFVTTVSAVKAQREAAASDESSQYNY